MTKRSGKLYENKYIWPLSITASSHNNTESEATHCSSGPPTILVTAPSRDDIYASKSNMTIADAVKERRPSSTPIVVGRKLLSKKWLNSSCLQKVNCEINQAEASDFKRCYGPYLWNHKKFGNKSWSSSNRKNFFLNSFWQLQLWHENYMFHHPSYVKCCLSLFGITEGAGVCSLLFVSALFDPQLSSSVMWVPTKFEARDPLYLLTLDS